MRSRASGTGFFRRWLGRSMRRSLAAGAVATASLALSAALVFCLVTVSAGVSGALGKELSAYGANVLVLPRSAPLRFGLGALELGPVEEERHLPEAAVRGLAAVDGVETVAPGLLARVSIGAQGGAAGAPWNETAGAVGYPLDALRRLNPLWRVRPRWPADGEGMIGAALAARLGVRPGETVPVAAEGGALALPVAAVVETGGPEDEDLFLPLERLQALTANPGAVSIALVRADLARLPPAEAARRIEAAVPGAEARTVAQVAGAERNLLEKVERLLLLVTIALCAATAFTVSGTLGVLLLARRGEIGLCLALGAGTGRVRALLLVEAAASGLLGGVAGAALGAVAAQAIAWSVFGAPVPVPWAALPLALATALALAVGAALWPVARALRLSPCDTLRAP